MDLYQSTRGRAKPRSLDELLLSTTADDGGLWVPQQLRPLPQKNYASYRDCAIAVWQHWLTPQSKLYPFVEAVVDACCNSFHHPDILPIRQLNSALSVLELFHGPSLAFKDFALKQLGAWLQYAPIVNDDRPLLVLVATSGDTGSAAIGALNDVENVHVVVLYPHNRISEIQRQQMTRVSSPRVHPIALTADFDSAQSLVKTFFNDARLHHTHRLMAVNSIHWFRIIGQMTYYVWAAQQWLKQHGQAVNISVPTGNFGNVYAAWLAKQMGAPIDRLIIATNRNDILHKAISQAQWQPQQAHPSLSPSMDITVPSNFERWLWHATADHERVYHAYLQHSNMAALIHELQPKLQHDFLSCAVDDDATIQTMKNIFERHDYIADPHTAVGLCAAMRCQSNHQVGAVMAVGCAHPAKFAETTLSAVQQKVEIPTWLAQHFAQHPEKIIVMPNSPDALFNYIQTHCSERK